MEIPRWERWPHILETQQFSVQDISAFVKHTWKWEDALTQGKTAATVRVSKPRPDAICKLLFYEASTRTEDTSWTAGCKLGFQLRDVPHPSAFSSAAKGESLRKAISAYSRTGGMGYYQAADCIIIRHKRNDAAEVAATVVDNPLKTNPDLVPLPVINGGNGDRQHPTQGVLDFYHLMRERGTTDLESLDNITIVFSGDLRYGRTTNSLLYLLSRFSNKQRINVVYSTHEQLMPKEGLRQYIRDAGIRERFVADFPTAIKMADMVSTGRIQKNRQTNGEYQAIDRWPYVFKQEYLELLKPGAFVTHPLPVNEDPDDPPAEIDPALDDLAELGDPRCAWMRGSHRGTFVRAALMDLIFAGIDQGWKRFPVQIAV